MSIFTRTRTRLFLTTTTAAGIAGTLQLDHRLRDLERRYPPQPRHPDSTFAVPPPDHAAHDICVFSAQVPRSVIGSGGAHRWTRHFLSSRPLEVEAKLFSRSMPDRGEYGFFPGQALLNGVFTVRIVREDRVVAEWSLNEAAVRFYERVAVWGYPWRLMSGGRHEWDVVEEEGGEEVEVRFGSVHFYREVGDSKRIPHWVGRLHQGYARYLVDVAVRELRREAAT